MDQGWDSTSNQIEKIEGIYGVALISVPGARCKMVTFRVRNSEDPTEPRPPRLEFGLVMDRGG